MSFPTTSLSPGSTGAAVQQLQNWLVTQGYLTQAQVNTGYGTYGPQTTAAVLQYQKDHGVDYSSGPGYWGPKSIAAASGTSSAPAGANATSVTTGQPINTNAPTNTGNMSYANASNVPVSSSVSGTNGLPAGASMTDSYGRTIDGYYQLNGSWYKLGTMPPGSTSSAPASSGSAATTSTIGLPTVNLQPGDTGANVQALQNFLVANGYMTQAQVNTGYGTYGPQTTAAVLQLQKDLGIDYSSGPGYYGPKTIAGVASATAQGSATGGGTGTGAPTTKTSGITFQPTGDPTLDSILKSISGVADGLVSNGYTIPANLQITPELIQQFLGYAHTAVDPYTKQLLDSRITDVNANLQNFKTNYENSVGGRQQQFGTDLATEQNNAGASGTAFSGMRNVNELNLTNSANRDLSTLGANAALNIGSAARAAAADVGAANAGGIQLPGLAGGSVSLAGGSRGSTGTTGDLAYNYNPGIYTVGTIPSAGINSVNQLEQNYLAQYGTLAGLNSNTGKSASDLIAMMSGIPGGNNYSATTPSLTPNTTPSLTPTIPGSSVSGGSTSSTSTSPYTIGQYVTDARNPAAVTSYTYAGNDMWSGGPVGGMLTSTADLMNKGISFANLKSP